MLHETFLPLAEARVFCQNPTLKSSGRLRRHPGPMSFCSDSLGLIKHVPLSAAKKLGSYEILSLLSKRGISGV